MTDEFTFTAAEVYKAAQECGDVPVPDPLLMAAWKGTDR